MGLTIHYSGKLKSASQLYELIDEARDIAIGNDWDYDVFHEKYHNDTFSSGLDLEKLYGIIITPKDFEPLSFTFLSDGRMCGIQNFNLLAMEEYIATNHVFTISINTLDLDVEIHKQLIVILDYISKKYIQEFKCFDEGQYWETRNEELLKEIFNENKNYLSRFKNLLESEPQKDDESNEDYVYQLANLMHKENHKSNEDLPKLSIEDEFKLIELKNEIEAEMTLEEEIPLEFQDIEFLLDPDLIEEEYQKAEKKTIYEIIGKPDFKKAEDLTPEELEKELKRFLKILRKIYIEIEMWFDYENENVLFYNFITQEIFQKEIAERFLSIYPHEYIYENYYPNHPEELHAVSFDFWKSFLHANRLFYDQFELRNVENAEEVTAFREIYPNFREIKIIVNEVVYDLEAAIAQTFVFVEFEGIKSNGDKVHYKDESVLELTYNETYNLWSVIKMSLPK